MLAASAWARVKTPRWAAARTSYTASIAAVSIARAASPAVTSQLVDKPPTWPRFYTPCLGCNLSKASSCQVYLGNPPPREQSKARGEGWGTCVRLEGVGLPPKLLG